MAYTLTRAAEADIINIYLEGATLFGVNQAERYAQELVRSFEFLSTHPKAARERLEINPPVRIHPSGVHMIVYEIDPNGDVLIIRVRHGREDWLDKPV